MFRHGYVRFARFVEDSPLELVADVTLLVASSYLIVQRTTNFAVSDWLLEHLLKQNAVSWYLIIVALSLGIAVAVKAACLIVKRFPASQYAAQEPEKIATCIRLINDEVAKHVSRCVAHQPIRVTALANEHAFDVNLRSIVHCLADHIIATVKVGLKRRDVFISVYTFEEEHSQLKYELHFDPRRDLIKSRTIRLDDGKYAEYESVKCLNGTAATSYVASRGKYTKGQAKRHKTVKQYMGCRLEHEGMLFGFLSIEFHRVAPFTDELEMESFMEEHVFPFRLLLEYQYLKSEFFRRFSRLAESQQVA